MENIFKALENFELLSSEDINNIYEDVIEYFKEKLNVDDSLSGYKSLISNQRQLLQVEQFTIKNMKLCMNCHYLSDMQMLISIYDTVIQDKFSKFSKQEKLNIIKQYNLEPLYESISSLTEMCYINKLDFYMKIPYEKLSDDIRLISNLGLIDYDGENIRPIVKVKK